MDAKRMNRSSCERGKDRVSLERQIPSKEAKTIGIKGPLPESTDVPE